MEKETSLANVDLQSNKVGEIPWPGPVPYDESQWKQFIGRGSVIKEILGKVQVARVTILLGESGAGKTSLVRAGLVPLLRLGRYTGKGEARGAWSTLLLREGGARSEDTVEVNWFQQLDSAIEALSKWSEQPGQAAARGDVEVIRTFVGKYNGDGSKKSRFVDLVERLSKHLEKRASAAASRSGSGPNESAGGLILVFDQFEEQLRSGPVAQRDAFGLIHEIVVGGAPVKILLAMRKEYRSELRHLEKLIGELGRNSVYLERLESPKVVQVIEKVSKRSPVEIDKVVAERLVGWLSPEVGVESTSEDQNREVLQEGSSTAAPDLLRLQAVLVELCRWAVKENERNITGERLSLFVSELCGPGGLQKKGKTGAQVPLSEREIGEKVLGSALERWIEAAISREIPDTDGSVVQGDRSPKGDRISYAKLACLKPEELRLQVRRIAVRMAPLLSSADYKIQQEETSLFRQSVGEDIAKLPLVEPTKAAEVDIIENTQLGKLSLDWLFLGGLNEPKAVDRWRILSGPARRWTAKETGDRLLACFKETLERLAAGNILRKTPVGKAGERRNYWELVHDQFGPNLVRWASNQRGSWYDCESSLVVCRGVQPLAVMQEEIGPDDGHSCYEVEGVSWQGCCVMQARLKPLVFRKVRFKDCYLVGTIFDGIEFVECSFESCVLKGALFRNCIFRSTSFTKCDSNVAIIGGIIENLRFQRCKLNQPAIKDVMLEGNLVYADDSKIIQGLFEDITVMPGREAEIFVAPDSIASYCFAGAECFSLLNRKNEDPDIPNSPLPEGFRTS